MMNYSRIHLMDIRFLLRQNKGYMYYMEKYIDKSIAEFTTRYEAEDFEALKLSDERRYDFRMEMLSETWQ